MVYGGLGRDGEALDSMWYVDVNEPNVAFELEMRFTGITPDQFGDETDLFRELVPTAFTFDPTTDCNPTPTVGNWDGYLCNPQAMYPGCDRWLARQIYDIEAAYDDDGTTTLVKMHATYPAYRFCLAPVFSVPTIWNRARMGLSNASALYAAAFVPEDLLPPSFETNRQNAATPSSFLLDWWEYNQNDGCRTGA
jgi:hypothetical protein